MHGRRDDGSSSSADRVASIPFRVCLHPGLLAISCALATRARSSFGPAHRARSAYASRRPVVRGRPKRSSQANRALPRRRHRPAPTETAAPIAICNTFEPPVVSMEPFAEIIARMMEPTAADDLAIQRLVKKRQHHLRRRHGAPPISTAPEPSSSLMMMAGFALIGIALKRRKGQGIGPCSCNAPIERVVS